MKITMGEYMMRKYGSKVRKLLSAEADFFGVKYPLPHSWYENQHVSLFDVKALGDHLTLNLMTCDNNKRSASLKAGLRAIGIDPSSIKTPPMKVHPVSSKNAKREAKSKIQSKVMAFDSDGRIKAGTLINAYGVEMVVIPRFENGSVWAVDESGAITECELGEVVIL